MMPKIFSTQKAIWSILKWSVESQIFLQIIKFELAKGKKGKHNAKSLTAIVYTVKKWAKRGFKIIRVEFYNWH